MATYTRVIRREGMEPEVLKTELPTPPINTAAPGGTRWVYEQRASAWRFDQAWFACYRRQRVALAGVRAARLEAYRERFRAALDAVSAPYEARYAEVQFPAPGSDIGPLVGFYIVRPA